jgi:hypothetical protein
MICIIALYKYYVPAESKEVSQGGGRRIKGGRRIISRNAETFHRTWRGAPRLLATITTGAVCLSTSAPPTRLRLAVSTALKIERNVARVGNFKCQVGTWHAFRNRTSQNPLNLFSTKTIYLYFLFLVSIIIYVLLLNSYLYFLFLVFIMIHTLLPIIINYKLVIAKNQKELL